MAQSYDHKRFTCRAMENQSSAGVCMLFKEIYSTCTNYQRLLLLCAKLCQKLFRNKKEYIFFLKDYTALCSFNRTKTDSQQAQVCQLKQFTRLIKFSQNRLKTVHVCNCVAYTNTDLLNKHLSIWHERCCLTHLFSFSRDDLDQSHY